MQFAGFCTRALCVAVIITAFTNTEARAETDIEYVLNPGSTFTAIYPNAPSTDPIPLTGTFVWRVDPTQGVLQPFHVVQMNLTAGQYRFSQDTTAANDEDSDTFTSGKTFFNEVLDATNLPFSPVWASASTSGTFTGDYKNPITISYPNIYTFHLPAVGGMASGYMAFTATQIPEPASLALVGAPLALLTLRRRSRLALPQGLASAPAARPSFEDNGVAVIITLTHATPKTA
jgi:hypothetical protein